MNARLFSIRARSTLSLRFYSKLSSDPDHTLLKPIFAKNPLNNNENLIVYDDAYSMRKIIIKENKSKSGIYM